MTRETLIAKLMDDVRSAPLSDEYKDVIKHHLYLRVVKMAMSGQPKIKAKQVLMNLYMDNDHTMKQMIRELMDLEEWKGW